MKIRINDPNSYLYELEFLKRYEFDVELIVDCMW